MSTKPFPEPGDDPRGQRAVESPQFLKAKSRSVLKAAVWGAAAGAIGTAAALAPAKLWVQGKSGEFWPDMLLGPLLIVRWPTLRLKGLLRLDPAPADSFFSSNAFGVIVNAPLVAAVFPPMSLF